MHLLHDFADKYLTAKAAMTAKAPMTAKAAVDLEML
jgi:hypothetical protein